MSETLVLQQDSTKLRWVLVGGMALAIISAWIGLEPGRFKGSPEFNQIFGLLGFLFFGAGSVLAMFKGAATLTLTPEGFATGERPLIAWASIERFFIVTIRGTKLVSYRLTPEARSALRGKAKMSVALSLTEVDGQVPAFLDRQPEEVCDLLEVWRARFAT